ncbi:uncharacterized protein LOC134260163 [Saccostrea cucullata]|uniref:uncharacterized protein LOC134260163 n=1 Tax=Saccostrea cuccullata TaxID=36930 RepID=UPI002ED566DC
MSENSIQQTSLLQVKHSSVVSRRKYKPPLPPRPTLKSMQSKSFPENQLLPSLVVAKCTASDRVSGLQPTLLSAATQQSLQPSIKPVSFSNIKLKKSPQSSTDEKTSPASKIKPPIPPKPPQIQTLFEASSLSLKKKKISYIPPRLSPATLPNELPSSPQMQAYQIDRTHACGNLHQTEDIIKAEGTIPVSNAQSNINNSTCLTSTITTTSINFSIAENVKSLCSSSIHGSICNLQTMQKENAKITCTIDPVGVVHIGIGGTLKITGSVNIVSAAIKWLKRKESTENTLKTTDLKYFKSSTDSQLPTLVINDITLNDEGEYKLSCESKGIITMSPTLKLRVLGEENPTNCSIEENNFIRFLMLVHLGTVAMRVFFDSVISPSLLQTHLKTHENALKSNKRINCSISQLDILYPAPPKTSSSADFDASLIYKLLRNTCNKKHFLPPTNGWGAEPSSNDIRKTDDIERIRLHRNMLCHDSKPELDSTTFYNKWTDLSNALIRLSNGCLKTDVEELRSKRFETYDKHQILTELDFLKKQLAELEDAATRAHIPKHIKEQHIRQIDNWKEDDLVFKETRGFRKVFEVCRSTSVITIVGCPASGKTSIARRIAMILECEGWEIVPLLDMKDMIEFSTVDSMQVFVCDDPFGIFSFDKSKLNTITKIKEVYKVFKNKKIICTIRKSIYKECSSLQSILFENVIDIDSEDLKLNCVEMTEIIASHCTKMGVKSCQYQHLRFERDIAMFPLLCKLFAMERQYQKFGVKFFECPYIHLREQFEHMRVYNNLQFAGLVLCVIYNNMLTEEVLNKRENIEEFLDLCGVNRNTSKKVLKTTLQAMVDTYVCQTGTTFSLIHDSVFEVVANMFGQKFPDEILKHLSSSFIKSHTIIADAIEGHDFSNDPFIIIERKFYTNLAKRLIEDIGSFQLFDVFQNNCLKRSAFSDVFLKCLDELPDTEMEHLFLHENCNIPNILGAGFSNLCSNKWTSLEYDLYLLLIDMRCDNAKSGETYNVKAINWVITYGHTKLLNYIASRLMHYLDNKIFTEDIHEQCRHLVLGVYSNNPEMIRAVLKIIKPEAINACPAGNANRWNEHRCFTPLTAASCAGYIAVIKVLIEHGADVNIADENGRTPLSIAIEKSSLEVVKCLVENSANVNEQINSFKGNALLCAVGMEDFEMAKYLLSVKADPNILNEDGNSPLHRATERGLKDIVQLLLDYNADINLATSESMSALHLATRLGNAEIVQLLLDCNADINLATSESMSALHLATRLGNAEITNILLRKGANTNLKNGDNETPLHFAACQGNMAIVKFLINAECEIDATNILEETPLLVALKCGHYQIGKLLTEIGANLNICDYKSDTPLSIAFYGKNGKFANIKAKYSKINKQQKNKTAFQNKDVNIVFDLIEYGADVNFRDCCNGTVLLHASIQNNNRLAMLLLQKNADVNYCDVEGNSPLLFAVINENADLVKLLLQFGADTNLYNKKFQSPLSISIIKKFDDMLEELIYSGGDVNFCDNDGNSLLHQATLMGALSVVHILISNKANTNIKNRQGMTALHLASIKNYVSIAKILIKNDCNVDEYNEQHSTALFLASARNNVEIVEMLIEAGARIDLFDVDKRTPLFVATYKSSMCSARLLLNAGADPNRIGCEGMSPLLSAVSSGKEDFVRCLLLHCKYKHYSYDRRVLIKAVELGNTGMVKLLIEHKFSVDSIDSNQTTPLLLAVERVYPHIIRILLDNNADVNICGKFGISPLVKSIEMYNRLQSFDIDRKERYSIVQMILNAKPDVNYSINGNSPLKVALNDGKGSREVVELLLLQNANINHRDNVSLLILAAEQGNSDIVQLLLDYNFETENVNYYGETALLVSLKHRFLHIAMKLLHQGANVNTEDDKHRSAIYFAVKANAKEAVSYILKKGCNFNLCNKRYLPFHNAVYLGYTEIVFTLMRHQADINLRDSDHRTALFWAVFFEDVEMVSILVNFGAITNVYDSRGKSPLILAVENSNTKILKILLEAGGNPNERHIENRNMPMLSEAVKNKQNEIVKMLLEYGADPNQYDDMKRSPLLWAIQEELFEICETLTRYNADIKAEQLSFALECNNLDIVRLLLKNGVNINKITFPLAKVSINTASENVNTSLQFLHKNQNKIAVVDKEVMQILNNWLNVSFSAGQGSRFLYKCFTNNQLVIILTDLYIAINDPEGTVDIPVINAVEIGDEIIVEDLLKKCGANMEIYNTEERTPFISASHNKNDNLVRLLIMHQSLVNSCNKSCRSPLVVACEMRKTKTAALLLNQGGEIDVLNEERKSKHLLAVDTNLVTTVDMPLHPTLYMNQDEKGKDPLLEAYFDKNCDLMIKLLGRNAEYNSVNEFNNIPFIVFAVIQKNLQLLHLLIERNYDINLSDNIGRVPLIEACRYSYIDIVQALAEGGADLNIYNENKKFPLLIATEANCISAIKILVHHGANINQHDGDGSIPLNIAIRKGYNDIVKFLLEMESKVDIYDFYGYTPLIYALIFSEKDKCKSDILLSLIANGSDVNLSDIDNIRPLNFAIARNQQENVDILLRNGAIVNGCDDAFDDDGFEIPLFLAMRLKFDKIVEILLSHNAHVNIFDNAGRTPLHRAVDDENIPLVNLLISYGSDVNLSDLQDKTEMSLLHIAIRKENTNLVHILSKDKSLVNDCDACGRCPLSYAADNTDIMRILMKSDDVLHFSSAYSYHLLLCDALHRACNYQNVGTVRLLLDYGFKATNMINKKSCLLMPETVSNSKLLTKIWARMNFCATPTSLIQAPIAGETEIVKGLCRKEILVNFHDLKITALHHAVINGNLHIVRELCSSAADTNVIDDKKMSPLLLAIEGCHLDIVRELCRNGANINLPGVNNSPLFVAANLGYMDIIEFLMKNGANLVSDRLALKQLLNLMYKNNDIEFFYSLLAKGADPNERECDHQGNTLLSCAVRDGKTYFVRGLLEHGATVNITDNDNKSPLLISVENNRSDITRILLQYNPDVNFCDNNKLSPLHVAIENLRIDIVRILLQKGAKVNAMDSNSTSPLIRAIFVGSKDMFMDLLLSNADVNQSNIKGQTPLHISLLSNRLDFATLLIHKNCEINVCDSSQITPLHIASEKGQLQIAQLLIEHGAELNGSVYSSFTPLQAAILNGCAEVVFYILQIATANSSYLLYIKHSIHLAAQRGYVDILEALLTFGINDIDFDSECNPLLKNAIQHGRTEVVRHILHCDTFQNINFQDIEFLLEIALEHEHFKIFDLLIETYGKNKLRLSNLLSTAIKNCKGEARRHNNNVTPSTDDKFVKCLITKSVDINDKDSNNTAPLVTAVKTMNVGVCRLLLENWACPNTRDEHNIPVLHIALSNKSVSIAKLLIEFGANVNATDRYGRSPIFLSCIHDLKEIISDLINHGANPNLCDMDGITSYDFNKKFK